MKIKKVAVFCGASIGRNEIYKKTAVKLGNYLANNNVGLVYGAGKIGMMGAVANAMLAKNADVIGVIPDLLRHAEVMHPNISKIIVTKTMSDRKIEISKISDAYIALAGGFGTLDELYEVLTLQQLYIETKPVGLLNTNGFFDATIKQLDHMVAEGFLQPKNRQMLVVDNTVDGLMRKLNNYKIPENTKFIDKIVKNDH